MRVNSVFTGFFTQKSVVGSGIAIMMLAIFFVGSSFTKHSDSALRKKETSLMIRQLGHRLLLQSGDSTSLVLPVTEIKEGTFVLEFENEFAFNPDSLLMLSRTLLSEAQFPSGYIVTVTKCMQHSIAFGFQINHNTPDILPCQGRSQPSSCYAIEITFPDFNDTTFHYPVTDLIYGGALVLMSVTLLVVRFRKHETAFPLQDQNRTTIKVSVPEFPSLGKFQFDVKHQRLLCGDEVISLTEKECRILELLNNNFGELISRETLMQKVWINDGVITGRSLDMFVSKLRKKLSGDPQLRITNIHGKGYKLQIHTE